MLRLMLRPICYAKACTCRCALADYLFALVNQYHQKEGHSYFSFAFVIFTFLNYMYAYNNT